MKATLVVLINGDKTKASVIWFDGTQHHAPVLLNKLKDEKVPRIIDYAKQQEICVMENTRLCEALYENAISHSIIPEKFFADVAEILAFVIKSDCTKAVITDTFLSEWTKMFTV